MLASPMPAGEGQIEMTRVTTPKIVRSTMYTYATQKAEYARKRSGSLAGAGQSTLPFLSMSLATNHYQPRDFGFYLERGHFQN